MIERIPKLKNINSRNFFLIAGPCVVENKDMLYPIAKEILEICEHFEIPFILKASYKKDNRTRIDSFTGIDEIEALTVIKDTAEMLNIPVLTDVHLPDEARFAANYVDILQIPAFLSRQTSLITEAAKTGKFINIKKGQFLSPYSIKFVIEKVLKSGNNNVFVTERGTTFGYQDLIVDFRAIPIMKKFGIPVVVDVTHSLQQPNQENGISGGNPELIETLARAAVAVGADGIFIETHPEPEKALSDSQSMLKLQKLKPLLEKLVKIRKTIISL